MLKSAVDSKDADDALGSFIASEMRQIPPGYEKDNLKLKIQQVIFETKYQSQTTSAITTTPRAKFEVATPFNYSEYMGQM